MSEKRNYEKEDRIVDIHHYDDRLVRGEEISNESRVQFSNPSGDLTANNISEVSGNVKPDTNRKAKPKTTKTQNIVNIVLISAAASGSTVLGVGAILKTPSVSVSLFSRNSTSLTFEVSRLNIDDDDRLVALLSYQDNEMAYDILNINEQAQASINEKFITYYELEEHTPYTFKILYYQDFNALDSEGNPIDNSEIQPRTLYSDLYETADYADEVGIELDSEYNHESLSFTIYNSTPLPFISIRLVTFSNKELFVKDTSEQEITFTVNDLPYDEDMYITVKYGDRGLAYLKVDAIPSEEVPEPEPQITFSSDSSNISFFEMSLTFTVADYTIAESLVPYVNGEPIEQYSSGRIPDTDEAEFMVHLTDLLPDETYIIDIYNGDAIIYSEVFTTPFVAKVEAVGKDEIDVTFSDEFMTLYEEQNEYMNFNYVIQDGSNEVIMRNSRISQENVHRNLTLYTETYSFILYSGDASVSAPDVFYSCTFDVEGSLRPIVNIEENQDCFVGYNYMSLLYNIDDFSQLETLSFYFDGVLQEIVEYDEQDSYFCFFSEELEPETTHEVKILDANGTVAFKKDYQLQTLVDLEFVSESNIFRATFNPSFVSDVGFDERNYRFEVVDDIGCTVFDGVPTDANDGGVIQSEAVFAYAGTYSMELYRTGDENDTGEDYTKFFAKSFQFEGHVRPEFIVSVNGLDATFTMTGGELPILTTGNSPIIDDSGAGSDGAFYTLEIYNFDAEYDMYVSNFNLESDPSFILNLENGGLNGETGSEYHQVKPGTYTFMFCSNYRLFYQGTFTIS